MSFFVKLMSLFLVNLVGFLVYDFFSANVLDDWFVVLSIYLVYSLYYVFIPVLALSIIVVLIDRYVYRLLDLVKLDIKILSAIYLVSFILGLFQISYLVFLVN